MESESLRVIVAPSFPAHWWTAIITQEEDGKKPKERGLIHQHNVVRTVPSEGMEDHGIDLKRCIVPSLLYKKFGNRKKLSWTGLNLLTHKQTQTGENRELHKVGTGVCAKSYLKSGCMSCRYGSIRE